MSASASGPAPAAQSDVAAALEDCRRAFWSVAVFSGVVNLLMLTGPLYMLQIYDRVLSSRSVPTLVALSIFLIGAYAFQGLFDVIRARVVVRAAALLDRHLGTTVHAAVVRLARQNRRPSEAHQPVRDLDQIRSFLTSSGPIAIVDLPWIPVFLLICFLLHPWLGLASTVAGVALLAVTVLTERSSRAPSRIVAQDAGTRIALVEAARRNSETIAAMGMETALAKRFSEVNDRYLAALSRASDVVSSYGSLSKVLRLLMQSAILGLGAYLVIRQELTAGAMIAASIMMGRALAPIETAIANWRAFIGARESIHRLSDTLTRLHERRAATELPAPTRGLEVDQVTVAVPGSDKPIVRDVRFRLAAGEALGVIGPSGAGKSSFLRTLLGIWRPAHGVVRLDGAAFEQWDQEAVGRHIGYVPQGVDLFDGTIAENIARMAIEPDSAAVLQAGRAAGAHEMIVRLPAGYDTRVGEAGSVLSAGQRQRIALARALYGDPFLLVLDEPHSNLDREGEAALEQAIANAKARRAIVVLVAHRPSALAQCDKVLVLANGVQQAFGARDEVLTQVTARPGAPVPAPVAASGNLKVVRDGTSGER